MFKKGNYTYFGLDEFFQFFSKRKLFFSKSDFLYKLNTRKQKIEVDKELFKSVTQRYFRIYFSELYYQNKPKYFFLSGIIEKTKSKKFYDYQQQKFHNHGIGFVWYLRPSISYLFNINMIKLTKSNYPLREIELRYRPHCNYDALKPLNKLLKELTLSNKKHY